MGVIYHILQFIISQTIIKSNLNLSQTRQKHIILKDTAYVSEVAILSSDNPKAK